MKGRKSKCFQGFALRVSVRDFTELSAFFRQKVEKVFAFLFKTPKTQDIVFFY
jgi:hypothetical protein